MSNDIEQPKLRGTGPASFANVAPGSVDVSGPDGADIESIKIALFGTPEEIRAENGEWVITPNADEMNIRKEAERASSAGSKFAGSAAAGYVRDDKYLTSGEKAALLSPEIQVIHDHLAGNYTCIHNGKIVPMEGDQLQRTRDWVTGDYADEQYQVTIEIARAQIEQGASREALQAIMVSRNPQIGFYLKVDAVVQAFGGHGEANRALDGLTLGGFAGGVDVDTERPSQG